MGKLERNFLWLTAANISGSFFAVLYFIYLARVLHAEYFGYLSYATTFIMYLMNVVDLGLSTYGVREIAKDHARARELVSNIVSFRLVMATGLSIAFVVCSLFFATPLVLKIIMAEAALMLVAGALATEWAFQGLEKMYMVFISFTTTGFLQLLLSFLLVRASHDVTRVPIISLIASLPVIVLFLRSLRYSPEISFDVIRRVRPYLSSSIVIWGISLCTQIYNGLDIVMLGIFRTPEEVGCYSVARRMAGGATLLMIFLANAVLPRLSSSFDRDMEEFRGAIRKFLKISAGIIFIVFVPISLFSDQIISMTVGAGYVSAGVPFKIMIVALVVVMFNLPYSTALIAARYENVVLKQAIASALLNIILNFVFVGKYGMIGASVSFLCAEILALAWILWAYGRRIHFRAT